MTEFPQVVFSITVIAAMILGYFGVRLIRRRDTRTKGILMVVMALVLVGNVAIWTV